MVADAEAHAAEDARRREEAEALNNADSLVYQVEKLLADAGDSVDADQRADVEAKLGELKSAIDEKDLDRIRSATEELSAISQQIGAAMYEQAAAAAGDAPGDFAGDAGADAADDDNIVDAEIVEDEEDGSSQ